MTGPRRIGVVLAVLSVSGWVWGAEPARQAPFLTISTLQQLRENYKAAKDYLPAYPVIMDGYWVIPGGKDSPRTFPNVEGEQELFSPNGDYVAVIRPHFYFDQQGELSDRVRFMRTDGTLMWYLSPAPWRVLPLDDGTSLGWASCPFLDMVLEVRDAAGRVTRTVTGIFGRVPGMNAELRVYSNPPVVLAAAPELIVGIDLSANVLWRFPQVPEVNGPWLLILGVIPNTGELVMGSGRSRGARSIHVVDVLSGELRRAYEWQESIPFPAVFSPSGRYGLCAHTGPLRVFDFAQGMFVLEHMANKWGRGITAYAPRCAVAESPLRVAYGDNETAVLGAGAELLWLSEKGPVPTQRIFSADGQTLAVIGIDKVDFLPVLRNLRLYRLDPDDG